MKKITVAMLSLAMLSSTVLAGNVAATISDFSGKVLINKGEGFVPASGLVSLNAGDKVMVGVNSFAVVSFADCAVSLSAPTVMSVTREAPCAAGSAGAAVIQPVAAAPVFPVPLLIVGVAGLAGFAVVASGVLDDNNGISSN